MAPFSIPRLRLRALSAAVPARSESNPDLELLGASRDSFVRTVGINTRRVAPLGLCASDLCIAAAEHLVNELDLAPGEIEALVFVTQTPDYLLPGNSMLAQQRLGLSTSACLLDLNQGCAGYVYGLASLASLLSATGMRKGLLLVGDTITRILSSTDKSTLPIFSDAGSATLVEQSPEADAMCFSLGSDGAGAHVIQVRGGGARQPFDRDSLVVGQDGREIFRAPIHLSMDGLDVLHYSLTYVAPSIIELLAFAGADIDTPDYYVFHQANRILNESLVRKLGIPADKAPESLFDYGNTSCATIPVTICHRLRAQVAQGRRTLLLSGFGAGFSWGSALVTSRDVLCLPMLELDGPNGH
jgi:3-oxoacyl-[acyl-carrier-protein] synthase-3